jgi:hypothetical protein
MTHNLSLREFQVFLAQCIYVLDVTTGMTMDVIRECFLKKVTTA